MPSIDQTISPENCSNMVQVREGVDAIDREMVALIARRFAYMDAAARIKTDRDAVRDEARKAEVIANVQAAAIAAEIPVEPVIQLWDGLVEASIVYEFDRWDETN